MRYIGKLYRALNPVWAAEPLSGRGAALYGGRFNSKGTPALYCSLTPMIALHEANQAGDLQPTMLVAYDADIGPIFDGTDHQALAIKTMDAPTLADPGWRNSMHEKREAPTQAFARRLIEAAYAGLLVPSYARGAIPTDRNLVLWRWETSELCRLTVIDDEGRLSLRESER